MVSSPWYQLVVPPGTLWLIRAQPLGTRVVTSSKFSLNGPQMGVGVGVGVGVPPGGVGVGPPFWRITPMLSLKELSGAKSFQTDGGRGVAIKNAPVRMGASLSKLRLALVVLVWWIPA